MLYLIATPIGNAKDITLRAIEIMQECDYILCEDTRHSIYLFNLYKIKKPLKSFHKFNERKQEDRIIKDLKLGKNICLISDAGTPCISDPGNRLVTRCYEEDLKVSAIPGACSVILGAILSGFNTSVFQFVGFLPKKPGKLKKTLKEAIEYNGITICYDTSKRVQKTIDALCQIDGNVEITFAKELTKLHETCIKTSANNLNELLKDKKIKGEIVLIINGIKNKKISISE